MGLGTPHVGLRTAHVDYLLRFLISRSTVHGGSVADRLDALESAIVALTHHWRDDTPILPARELRASNETIAELLAWVEQGGAPVPTDLPRLGVYASGALTDDTVPEGWLRVRLGDRDR
jgi:hypothetical protein